MWTTVVAAYCRFNGIYLLFCNWSCRFMGLHFLGCNWVYPSTQLDFGRELIVLHTSTPSMLGKFSVHLTLAGWLRGKLILACQEVLKCVLTLNKPRKIGCSFFSILNTTSEHAPQVERKGNNFYWYLSYPWIQLGFWLGVCCFAFNAFHVG